MRYVLGVITPLWRSWSLLGGVLGYRGGAVHNKTAEETMEEYAERVKRYACAAEWVTEVVTMDRRVGLRCSLDPGHPGEHSCTLAGTPRDAVVKW